MATRRSGSAALEATVRPNLERPAALVGLPELQRGSCGYRVGRSRRPLCISLSLLPVPMSFPSLPQPGSEATSRAVPLPAETFHGSNIAQGALGKRCWLVMEALRSR